jgi:conjugative transfer signal peptidase TraF
MSQPLFVLSFAAAFGVAIAALIARLARVNSRAARAVALAAVTAIVGVTALAIFGSRLRVNFTPSMPLGIYRLETLPATGVVRGMVVAVCAPADAADLGRRRGYLSTGRCPHDTELLLKIVAGVPGDDVAVSAEGVAVNRCSLPDSRPIASDRAGRRMRPWPWGDYHLGRGEVWLYAGNPRSWDSRYWGPAPLADVRARAVPLLVASSASLWDERGSRAAVRGASLAREWADQVGESDGLPNISS